MRAYIKGNSNQWRLTNDPEVILNTDLDCVIAESADEALEIINQNFNPYGPDFIVAYKQEYRGHDEANIYSLKEPAVRENMTFFEALALMKNTGETIRVRHWDQKNKWRDEVGYKDFCEFGVYYNNYTFEYNLKKAEKQKKQIRNIYAPVSPRKHFIRAYELVNLKNGLNNEFRSAVYSNYGFNDQSIGILVRVIKGDDRKDFISQYIMMSLNPFNAWFGQYSYRKTAAFQEFKQKWKERKPKTAKSIGISQELFDFMEKEVKIRRPKNMKFKGKKVIRNDKSCDV